MTVLVCVEFFLQHSEIGFRQIDIIRLAIRMHGVVDFPFTVVEFDLAPSREALTLERGLDCRFFLSQRCRRRW